MSKHVVTGKACYDLRIEYHVNLNLDIGVLYYTYLVHTILYILKGV